MERVENVYAPYIGANGNWYINGEDTGARAQGRTGNQGPTGPQGMRGPAGVAGDRGPQGIQGSTGATGNQGAKGDKGDKGETGAQGAKGDTPELAVNLATLTTGKALDATMGKALDDKVVEVNRKLSSVCITQTFSIPLFSLAGFGDAAYGYIGSKIVSINTPAGYQIISITPITGEWVIHCTVVNYNSTSVVLAIANLYPAKRDEVNIGIVVAYAKI